MNDGWEGCLLMCKLTGRWDAISFSQGWSQKQRMKKGMRYAAATVAGYSLVSCLILWFLAEPLMYLFIDAAEAVIAAEGVKYLHTVGPFYWGIGCLFLFYGIYRALGKPSISVILTVISLGTRVALSYMLSSVPSVGVAGIWQSIPVGWILADLAGILFYIKNKNVFTGF